MNSTTQDRLSLVDEGYHEERDEFGEHVRAGLTADPKRLSSRFLYDHEGALLFERICTLPEYYPTRSEREILERNADEIAASFEAPPALVELGSGSATKTRILIESFLRRFSELHYIPVDVSREMLEASATALVDDYDDLNVTGFVGEYGNGLRFGHQLNDGPMCVLWLGSSVGNLDRNEAAEFLRCIRETMTSEDRLLMGVDLRKDRETLERAYDDSQGVTAKFNHNILARINRELGGEFDIHLFRHRARYLEKPGRVESHLVSTEAQEVRIRRSGLRVGFSENEAIHTENSYKYSEAEIDGLAGISNFQVGQRWFDSARRFSVNLLRPTD